MAILDIERTFPDAKNGSPVGGPAIGVFGHYGNQNLGDEAIIEALIGRLRRQWPDGRIIAFSIHPLDTRLRHGVPAFPIRIGGEYELAAESGGHQVSQGISGGQADAPHKARKPGPIGRLLRWGPFGLARRLVGRVLRSVRDLASEVGFLVRSYKRVRGLDALIIAGSNQFLDNFGGPWGFPYTLLKWSILARLAGCRVYAVSVGAGPLDSRLSMAMVRACLPLADYVSFRDAGSRRLVLGDKALVERPVYPDLAHSLEFPSARTRVSPSRERPVVGINPMPMYDDRYWCEPDRGRYQRFVDQLAAFTHRLRREGYPVFLFPTQPKDVDVAHDVAAAMARIDPGAASAPLEIRRPRTTQELMAVIDEADIVVATRFHGALLSLHAWKPVLAICYYRKTRELMQDLQQERYAVDLDALDPDDLWTRFKDLERRAADERQHIQSSESKWRDELEQQYTMLLQRLARGREALNSAS